MEAILKTLSDNETLIYRRVIEFEGTIDERIRQLNESNIFNEYNQIHSQYLEIFYKVDEVSRLEILKRLIFLNWYQGVEPSFYTGIGHLDDTKVYESYRILNDYIDRNKLDSELSWMLSYYSSWDWMILDFAENKLIPLVQFVKAVDTSVLHVPKEKSFKATMNNRGQMGIYFQGFREETT